MARGGRRRGRQGAQYPNRSDLRGPGTPDIPKTFQGQPYGVATQQAAMQAPTPASPSSPVVGSGPEGMLGPSGPPPGGMGPFNRPTERPSEPITHGLPSGAGGGPEILGMTTRNDPVTLQLRALYQQYPIPELAELLDEI
jgi:hypothetical protein